MSIHNSSSGDSPIAEASGKPLSGNSAIAAIITIFSMLTTNCEVNATTAVLPERCASSMKTATHSQTPNIAAAASTWTNLTAKMTSGIRSASPPPERGRCEGTNSKWNFVVHIAAAAAAGHGCRRDLARRAGRAEFAGIICIAATARRTAAGAVEQCQLATETLQHHFGRVAVLTGLVLPFARLQRAFDENLRTLLEILLGDPAQILIEDDNAVPFGFFAPLAGRLVFPGFRSGETQIRNRASVLGATNFRIRAQIADQDHLVDASRHDTLRCSRLSANFSKTTLVPGQDPARTQGWIDGVIHTRTRGAGHPTPMFFFCSK